MSLVPINFIFYGKSQNKDWNVQDTTYGFFTWDKKHYLARINVARRDYGGGSLRYLWLRVYFPEWRRTWDRIVKEYSNA